MTLLEKETAVGGQATSIEIDDQKYGASWMNNGVQGGSSVCYTYSKEAPNPNTPQIFKHTFNFFRQQGYPPEDVRLQVSFGKGKHGFWTNCFPSLLLKEYSSDIRKFGLFLKITKYTLPVLGLVPISVMLRVFMFSRGFGDKMVYPLIALFLGTGNQTASVPCGIVERLFNDPNMKLWDYDSETLLPNLPTMYTFDKLHDFYATWREQLTNKGVITRTGIDVQEVASRSSREGIVLRFKDAAGEQVTEQRFDDMVLCTLADESLRILGNTATWREKFVLGGAAFYDDITVTHTDSTYFNQHYETRFDQELCAEPTTDAQRNQIQFSRGSGLSNGDGFRPMYFTHTYESDPRLIEMSFNCSNYQHQFRHAHESIGADMVAAIQPVYQTIFLNKQQKHMWTINKIDQEKIIQRNWWHQLGHRWQHYLRVVPGMMFIQGKNSTCFAGSWTLVVSRFGWIR